MTRVPLTLWLQVAVLLRLQGNYRRRLGGIYGARTRRRNALSVQRVIPAQAEVAVPAEGGESATPCHDSSAERTLP